MKRVKELLAAVFLALVTLGVTMVSASPGTHACRRAGAAPHHARCDLHGDQSQTVLRPAHPHFLVGHAPLASVAASSRRPVFVPRLRPRHPDLRKSDPTEDPPSVADLDTDTDDGVSTVVSYRYLLAADVREADLPLGVNARPQGPVLRSGSPRGPPVS